MPVRVRVNYTGHQISCSTGYSKHPGGPGDKGDGGLLRLSNPLLTELLKAHEEAWLRDKKMRNDITYKRLSLVKFGRGCVPKVKPRRATPKPIPRRRFSSLYSQ